MSQGGTGGPRWADYRLASPVDPEATTLLATDLAAAREVELTPVISSEVAEALVDLDSPYVVGVRRAFEFRSSAYAVSDRTRGTRLDRLLHEHGALEPQVAVAVLAQVAAGLRDLHAAGLRHGRLTATEVVLGAAPGDELTTRTPVRITGAGGLEAGAPGGDVADDVLAAGRVLQVCLQDDDEELTEAEPDAAPEPGSPAVPPVRPGGGDRFARGLSWVLARSTADDAGKRHRDAAALRADLLTLLPADDRPEDPPTRIDPALPVAAPAGVAPPPAPEGDDPTDPAAATRASSPAATTAPRRRLVPALAALVVLLVVVGVAVAVLLGRDEDAPEPSGRPAATPDVERAVRGDVDGDGLGDVVQVHRVPGAAPELYVNPSKGDGLRVRRTQPAPPGPLPLLADLDGDGVVEVLARTGQAPLRLTALTGDGLGGDGGDGVVVTGTGQIGEAVPVVGDYDGDGTDDLAFLVGDEVRVALGGDPEIQARPWAQGVEADGSVDTLLATDLDGDGRDDLVVVRRSVPDSLLPLLSDGERLEPGEPSAALDGLDDAVLLGADLSGEGDGRVLVVPPTGGGSLTTYAYDGSGWAAGEAGPLPGNDDEQVLSAATTDLDGDGRDDLVVLRGPRLVFDVTLGDGDQLGQVDAFVEMPLPDPATTATLVGGSEPPG